MANFNKYFPIENQLEGTVFEDVVGDSGSYTKYGITIDDVHEYNVDLNQDGGIDWKDVRDMTAAQASQILKKLYWDYFKADNINNQSVAEYIVDSGLNQGRVLIVKYIQVILGIAADGAFGPTTLAAINAFDQEKLFTQLHDRRVARYNAIIASNPSQQKFFKGWISRVNAIKYMPQANTTPITATKPITVPVAPIALKPIVTIPVTTQPIISVPVPPVSVDASKDNFFVMLIKAIFGSFKK